MCWACWRHRPAPGSIGSACWNRSIAPTTPRAAHGRRWASQHKLTLPSITLEDGLEYPVDLHIIEWSTDTKRTLYLCSGEGFPVDQVETRFHVPGFSFSAYLKSPYVERLHNEERIGLAEMDPALNGAVERARYAIKDYFRERAAERAQTVVDAWKAADVYPYRGEPQTPVERAERQMFDIVAVHVQEIAPDIGEVSTKTKRRCTCECCAAQLNVAPKSFR